MVTQEQLNYDRIANAISYLNSNFKTQPDLDQIAEKMNLSPFHFQRLFSDWAGVSPKKFIQYLTVTYAKERLKAQDTLFDVAFQTGLSGTGRLHDLFVTIEGMTPGEFKNGGEKLLINYSLSHTSFGEIIIASTEKGICNVAFIESEVEATETLKQQYPCASYQNKRDILQESVLQFFNRDFNNLQKVKLHLKGTAFQLKVWETLLKIPVGNVASYGGVAQQIGHPNASRAVGSAIADNPIAILIPCHRIIQASGNMGNYHWGATRKAALLGWEASQLNPLNND